MVSARDLPGESADDDREDDQHELAGAIRLRSQSQEEIVRDDGSR